ncbi:MAG TPA: HAD-IIIA family hydrolase [Gammaproteobacteria bacterium]|nr:HAD-IIIA family hydrolase [Gammaproteobacteria bacterium]
MEHLIEKAKQIRLLILDVDGVLTTGNLVYTKKDIHYKSFYVHDGLGIKLLQKSGVLVGIITTCKSAIIQRRAQDLGIQHIYAGYENKLTPYQDLKQKLSLQDQEIAYVGDDLPDLPLIRRVGLGMTVANAPSLLQQKAAYVSKASGGLGAVREICEFIMQAQGTYSDIIEAYLQ